MESLLGHPSEPSEITAVFTRPWRRQCDMSAEAAVVGFGGREESQAKEYKRPVRR